MVTRIFLLILVVLPLTPGMAEARVGGTVTLSNSSSYAVRSIFRWFVTADGSINIKDLHCTASELRIYSCSYFSGVSHNSHQLYPISARMIVATLNKYVARDNFQSTTDFGVFQLPTYDAAEIDCPAKGPCTLTAGELKQ